LRTLYTSEGLIQPPPWPIPSVSLATANDQPNACSGAGLDRPLANGYGGVAALAAHQRSCRRGDQGRSTAVKIFELLSTHAVSLCRAPRCSTIWPRSTAGRGFRGHRCESRTTSRETNCASTSALSACSRTRWHSCGWVVCSRPALAASVRVLNFRPGA
jgi:hypothetical protein